MELGESLYSGGSSQRNECPDVNLMDNKCINNEFPDIDFVYGDSDTHENEIAELYTYSEGPEFNHNLKAFEDVCGELDVVPLWQSLTEEGRKSLVIRLSDHLELSKQEPRMKAARAILYICQGCWGEVQSDQEQMSWVRKNVILLLECGLWYPVLQLLYLEIDPGNPNNMAPKLVVSVSLANSADLRVILSILYTIVETIRVPKEDDSVSVAEMRDDFRDELAQPQIASGELLAMTLMGMVTRFCNSSAPQFPIRKVLLLLWKVLLFSLGGTNDLRNLKEKYRKNANLDLSWEDTLEVSRSMRASSPPASASDLIEQQNNQRKRPFRRQQGLVKQSSLDDSVGEMYMPSDDEQVYPDEPPDLPRPSSPRPSTPVPSPPPIVNKGLPWTPKVRQKDIDAFLSTSRVKFVGYTLPNDRSTLAGMPQPIHECVQILSKHIYVSLAEVQIKREDEITRSPLSRPEGEVDQNPTELLYQAMLLTLPQSMIALLKVLLASSPTAKAKTESISVVNDVLPEEMPISTLQSMKLRLDVNRHKEVLVKAVSAILLLLLKHFKINHVYQFEFMSQHLVFANCIPLILKFLNQNLIAYVQAENSVAMLDFPACVIGYPPEMTAESFEASTGATGLNDPTVEAGSPNNSFIGETTTSFCCHRNMLACINLLRVLNKLCKWKHSRIMMLVVFKSAPILKRSLKVKHAMMQLYVLKLLKTQTKYLGRQWRKTNMKTLSAIYQKVRHRLNDDWAYGNDPDARPWDFQTQECALRHCVDRFNNRRYNANQNKDPDFEPVDNCVTSVLGRPMELTEEFKRHYEIWLQQEVLSISIDWDQLITSGI